MDAADFGSCLPEAAKPCGTAQGFCKAAVLDRGGSLGAAATVGAEVAQG